jgi:protein involved in polysaccharide export with SLBB domain
MMQMIRLLALVLVLGGGAHLAQAQSAGAGRPRPVRIGDRVLIEIINPLMPPTLNDTFVVREGHSLRLPGIAQDIPLQGVTEVDLTTQVNNALRRDLQNPNVRATLMLGVFMTGQVAQPGATWVRPDDILRDAVTAAGTVTAAANIDKIVVKRQGDVIYSRDDVRRALTDGRTFADLNIINGDEIEVGEKRRITFFSILSVATTIVSLAFTIVTLSRD